jgi:hypothetical protein
MPGRVIRIRRNLRNLLSNHCRRDFVRSVRGIGYGPSGRGHVFDIVDHPNQERYPGQQIHVIAIEEYVYLVPFVESEEEVFLKTIIPSRRATKSYLGEGT